MYYVKLKKIKFLSLIIVLFFAFLVLSLNVRAEDELVLLPDEEQAVNSDFSEDDGFQTSTIVKRKARSSKKMPSLHDHVFVPSNSNVTFNALVMRVSLIIFALIGFLVLIKMFLSRDQFAKPGSFLDELAQKFTGSFSNSSSQGLKLKQTLILTPGQNLYLIEIDDKRLLVGGTQQGGVQFLTDLTKSTLKNEELDFKQIEEYKIPVANGMNNNGKETPFMTQDVLANKDSQGETKQSIINQNSNHVFKRRTNFRQSLFNENINNEDLIHSK